MLLVYRHDIFLRDENLPFFGQIEGHDKELLSKRVTALGWQSYLWSIVLKNLPQAYFVVSLITQLTKGA